MHINTKLWAIRNSNEMALRSKPGRGFVCLNSTRFVSWLSFQFAFAVFLEYVSTLPVPFWGQMKPIPLSPAVSSSNKPSPSPPQTSSSFSLPRFLSPFI